MSGDPAIGPQQQPPWWYRDLRDALKGLEDKIDGRHVALERRVALLERARDEDTGAGRGVRLTLNGIVTALALAAALAAAIIPAVLR